MTNEELQSHLTQAAAAEAQGNYDEAERLSQLVLAALSSPGLEEQADTESVKLQADATRKLGSVCLRRGDYSQALGYLQRSLQISEQINDKAGIAGSLGNMGAVLRNLGEFPQALECFGKALSIDEELDNKSGLARWLGNFGSVHQHLSSYTKALEYYGKALGIAEETGDKSAVASLLGNIGNVYLFLSDYPQALEYYGKALSIDEELGNKSGLALWLGNIGHVHKDLGDSTKALEYYGKALRIDEELGDKSGVARHLSNIGIVYARLSDYPKALEYYDKALILAEEVGNKSVVANNLGNIGNEYMKLSEFAKAQEYLERAKSSYDELGRRSEVGEINGALGELYASESNPNRDEAKAEAYLLDSIALSQELGTKKYAAHKGLADLYEKQKRWEESHYHLGKYFSLKEEVQSEEARKKAQLMEQQKQIAEREKEIAIAKAAADAQMSATTKLLYKVLPQSVATRMIEGDEEIADYYTSVSILFADIAGFTPISADMPAIIVVRFLNYVFGEFDRIMKKHGCEKIKTIGDGYMAVCGAPLVCEDHAERLAAAALEMQETITLPESIREYMPKGVKLGVRIGLHTGSVVAGVIGEERFVYDIYSDAVNTAARMESHGEENKIHVSSDFFRHLQNRFAMTKNTTHGISFEKREEMEIKGKGMMRTYFLERA